MAQITGVLNTTVQIDTLNLVKGIPVGPLTAPYVLDAPPIGVVQTITNRFPVPPSAAGFLVMPTDEEGNDPIRNIAGVMGNPIIGALFPESRYLEPTIGQIWPR